MARAGPLVAFPAEDMSRSTEARAIACRFVKGSPTWLAADLTNLWRELVVQGYVVREGPASGRFLVRERSASIRLGALGVVEPTDERVIRELLDTSRERVVDALRHLLLADDDTFVHRALYRGTIIRENGAWQPRIREDDALSDWMLALFAADVVEHRCEYDDRLSVCDQCGGVELGGGVDRRHCAQHRGGGAPSSGAFDREAQAERRKEAFAKRRPLETGDNTIDLPASRTNPPRSGREIRGP
jgi:hypothetical protein